MMNLQNKRILISGGSGFFGTNLTKTLKDMGISYDAPDYSEYDLRNRKDCETVVKNINVVIHLAAQVGGIGFLKNLPGEVFYNNVKMGLELMDAARLANVKKFVSMGSVCEYPDETPIPFKEKDLWNGYPEYEISGYGMAKRTLLAQGQMYRRQYGFDVIHIIPVNLYGPNDHFGSVRSHVIPALISRFVDARDNGNKNVEVWGSGNATREFIYIEDAVEGVLNFTQKYSDAEPINLATSEEIKIKDLVSEIVDLTGYKGKVTWNKDKPEGTRRRKLDITKAKKLGFVAKTNLHEGLKKTIQWYEENREKMAVK